MMKEAEYITDKQVLTLKYDARAIYFKYKESLVRIRFDLILPMPVMKIIFRIFVIFHTEKLEFQHNVPILCFILFVFK